MENASGSLQVRLNEATATIFSIMSDENVPSQVRLNAARTVYEFCYKFIEQHDILSRLDALEALANEDNGR